jgi:hypothetical protein
MVQWLRVFRDTTVYVGLFAIIAVWSAGRQQLPFTLLLGALSAA